MGCTSSTASNPSAAQDGVPKDVVTSGTRNFTFKVESKEDGMAYFSEKGRDSKYAIVLIQEWWGLNKSICDTADVFANQGFAVLAVDIYRGKTADSKETAGHLFSGLDFPGAVADILAAAKALKEKGYEKVAITGFCMGGALTIAAIATGPDVFTAAAPFYGVPDLSKFSVADVKTPVLAHFGTTDEAKGFSDPESAKRLEDAFKAGGHGNFTLRMWEAGHAFMNQSRPDTYDPEIAKKALAETVAFFKKY